MGMVVLLHTKTIIMQIIKAIGILAIMFKANILFSQSQDTIINKPIRPFIISTDLLSPINIGVEKMVSSKIAFKVRYHYLIFNQLARESSIHNQSLIVDLKYYFNKVQIEKINPYISVFGKWRQTNISSDSIEEISNAFTGVNAGFLFLTDSPLGKLSFEANCGLGFTIPTFSYNSSSRFDLRANIGVGIPLFKMGRKIK
jgi:Protein of unknown function (DUF3575)